MVSIVYFSGLVLVLILLIMIEVCSISHVSVIISSNYLMLIMIIVVSSIFTFVGYYMGGDVSNENFNLVMLIFLILIVLMLSSFGVLIFLSWESIGVISIILIGYWIRPSSKSGAISAMMYNRWSDLVFLVIIYQVISELIVILLVFAILCKSSLYLWEYWLPVAIEGPTPVSSLLHSSTIVVASVYLIMLITVKISIIVVVVLLLSINMVGHFDVKKNIAYSTSIHLLVILILSVSEIYHAVVVYIILHGIVKSQIFQSSSYSIHGVSSQDIRNYIIVSSTYIIMMGIVFLSALIGMVIVAAKELVVLSVISFMILLLVVMSYIYTVSYINNCELESFVGEVEGFYVLVLVLCSLNVLAVNFSFWVSFLVFSLGVIYWMGNPMNTLV